VQDLVSEADRACEDLIAAGLAQLFPRDGFVGEERGSRNADAAAVWVIDPIDGTHNFLTGIPFWCVSVGLVAAGKLALGIIYHPLAAELFSARKGGGAFLNGQPIAIRQIMLLAAFGLAAASRMLFATGSKDSADRPGMLRHQPAVAEAYADPRVG
jgi:fructose-1,6-bisphosphatase/inositol monophosphatase family enzyme